MSPTPCSRAAACTPCVSRIDSTRSMCRPKKSMTGQRVLTSSRRTSSLAAVATTRGVRGLVSSTASSRATTSRASSIEEMNGISVRSKRTSGNWISNALPMVSALMPVLSERKKTGTTSGAPPATRPLSLTRPPRGRGHRLRAPAPSSVHHARSPRTGERVSRHGLACWWQPTERLASFHSPAEVVSMYSMRQRLAAELFGTFWLVLGGCGTAVLASYDVKFLGVAFAFGLTVLTMAYAVGHISGGHFNPAITIGLATGRRFDWREVPAYVVTQIVGAIVAAGVLLVIANGTDGFD